MMRICFSLCLIMLAVAIASCGDDIETESACMQLDTSVQRHVIRDYQYARHRFFDLGMIGGVSYLGVGDSILEFRLYQSAGNLDPGLPEAVAYPNAFEPTSSPDSVQQRFRQVEIYSEYDLYWDGDEGRFYIFFPELLQNVQTTTLAYYMVVKKTDRSLLTFGSFSGSKLRLQMLKRSQSLPTDPLWNAEWKNVYDLGRRNLDYDRLLLDIYKGAPGDESNSSNLTYQLLGQYYQYYLRVLGLDSIGSTGSPPPDNKIDDDPAKLNLERGLVFIPRKFPFADSVHLEDPTSIIYTSSNPVEMREGSKYFLRISYPFDLGFRDIVEGSVSVTLDGVPLNTGYHVFSSEGLIAFDESIWPETAEVQVCFEYWK